MKLLDKIAKKFGYIKNDWQQDLYRELESVFTRHHLLMNNGRYKVKECHDRYIVGVESDIPECSGLILMAVREVLFNPAIDEDRRYALACAEQIAEALNVRR